MAPGRGKMAGAGPGPAWRGRARAGAGPRTWRGLGLRRSAPALARFQWGCTCCVTPPQSSYPSPTRIPRKCGEKPRRVPGPALWRARGLPASGVRGWGSGRRGLQGQCSGPGRQGSPSLQPAILKDCLTSPISVPGQGPLERLAGVWIPALLPSLATGLPGFADPGEQTSRYPSGLGQHGLR